MYFVRVLVSADWSVPGQGHCSLQLVPALPTRFCCFPGPGAGTQGRPRCYLEGGDLLDLAVSCLASLFSGSVFPFYLPRGFPSFSQPHPLGAAQAGTQGRVSGRASAESLHIRPHGSARTAFPVGFPGVCESLGPRQSPPKASQPPLEIRRKQGAVNTSCPVMLGRPQAGLAPASQASRSSPEIPKILELKRAEAGLEAEAAF